jgi:archaellin
MRINNQTYINTCSLSVIEFIVKKIHNYSINSEQKNYISSLLNDEGLSINNLESILSSYSIESETFYVSKIKKSDFYNNQIFIIPVKKQDY